MKEGKRKKIKLALDQQGRVGIGNGLSLKGLNLTSWILGERS